MLIIWGMEQPPWTPITQSIGKKEKKSTQHWITKQLCMKGSESFNASPANKPTTRASHLLYVFPALWVHFTQIKVS